LFTNPVGGYDVRRRDEDENDSTICYF